MANATDNIFEAEKMICTIFSGADREKALQICRWLFEFNRGSNGYTIKCYCTEVPDVCFCVDRGGDCDSQKIRTWFFRIRKNLLYILRREKPSAPYILPENGTGNYYIPPKVSQHLNDAMLNSHVVESYNVMLKRLRLDLFEVPVNNLSLAVSSLQNISVDDEDIKI